jgi:MerR family redox-sensitive transcriptional activator SoxR
MPDLTISEVARRAGLSASALRYYERRRLIPAPPRRAGRRCYDAAIVPRLRLIAAARRAGLALREIGALVDAAASRPDLDAVLASTLQRLDRRIDGLERLRADLATLAACDCAAPMRCGLVTAIEPTRA